MVGMEYGSMIKEEKYVGNALVTKQHFVFNVKSVWKKSLVFYRLQFTAIGTYND